MMKKLQVENRSNLLQKINDHPIEAAPFLGGLFADRACELGGESDGDRTGIAHGRAPRFTVHHYTSQ